MLPRLTREHNGTVLVRAFTDLKRHVIGDADFPWFLNERVVQSGIPTDQFLTRKLWDAGNSAPYGHGGDLTTINEAILNHGGEGRQARDAFAALPIGQQNAVVEFLKSLQILPEGATQPSMTSDEVLQLHRQRRGPLQ
ncbi:MAG: di-heme oxidoredictase family protein [Bryobacteraceae bacterium]